MDIPSPNGEGGKKKPYIRPAFRVFRRPPPAAPENPTILKRLRGLIGKLFARVRGNPLDPVRTWELATEIVDFAHMRSTGTKDVVVAVPELAFHMREKPRHVQQSLRLLETKGKAKRTTSKDHWKLTA
jgi:hypothetical protein